MKKIALVLFALAFSVSTASAVDVAGKKGIGFASAIGGPSGLAFNYGMPNMNIEVIFGVPVLMPKESDGAGYMLNLGAGVHYHALRAKNAAFTVGGRLVVGLAQGVTPKGGDAPDSISQINIDIPMRVYWFPSEKNISFHVEGGIGIALVGEDGAVFGGDPAAPTPEGTYIDLLNKSLGMGMTFWW